MTMSLQGECLHKLTRRHFLGACQAGIGAVALNWLLARDAAASDSPSESANPLAPKQPPLPARPNRLSTCTCRARRRSRSCSTTSRSWSSSTAAVSRRVAGGAEEGAVRLHQRRRPKLLGTPYKFAPRGRRARWSANCCPHSEVIDDLAVIRSMHTDQFNHAPAELLLFTGSPRFGGAAMGSWVT